MPHLLVFVFLLQLIPHTLFASAEASPLSDDPETGFEDIMSGRLHLSPIEPFAVDGARMILIGRDPDNKYAALRKTIHRKIKGQTFPLAGLEDSDQFPRLITAYTTAQLRDITETFLSLNSIYDMTYQQIDVVLQALLQKPDALYEDYRKAILWYLLAARSDRDYDLSFENESLEKARAATTQLKEKIDRAAMPNFQEWRLYGKIAYVLAYGKNPKDSDDFPALRQFYWTLWDLPDFLPTGEDVRTAWNVLHLSKETSSPVTAVNLEDEPFMKDFKAMLRERYPTLTDSVSISIPPFGHDE